MGLMALGDEDLLAGPGSGQKLREVGAGFRNLVRGGWHDWIPVFLLTEIGEADPHRVPNNVQQG